MYVEWIKILFRERLVPFFLTIAFSLSWLFVPFQWYYFNELRYSSFEILLFNSIFCVTAIISEIPLGIFADRFGRVLSIRVGTILIVIGEIILILFQDWLAIAIAQISLSLGMSSISGADSAYLYDCLNNRGLGKYYPVAESFLLISKCSIMIGGTVLVSLLLFYYSVKVTFFVSLIMGVISF